ncbi:ABC transporter ATP-binding protein [Bacillaceae bacterium Marseille-Q3522]|nr:ABC transporter ATP-binding protein [Bacillaceae bacterium Marseille-Q3522]
MSIISIHIEKAGYEPDEAKIQDIEFSINKKEMIGLIGANGAGKSTTIKSILGIIPYLQGNMNMNENVKISYLPERPVFYDELTLQEHIDFITSVEQIGDDATKRTSPLLELFQMDKHIHELPATYSKGMQQKAMIILALMTEPDLLIIDEPFMGLDPIATKQLLDIIQQERDRGAGILMCTHVLDTAEKICDRFVLLNLGQQLTAGTLADLREACMLPEATLFDCYHHLINGDNHE